MAFMPVTVDTSGRVYDDFNRLHFLHTHREVSTLTNELPEELDQFRFLRSTCLTDLETSVGFILVKTSVMRMSIPIDLSSRPFIPLPCFIRSRRPIPLLTPSLVRVTFFILGSLVFYSDTNKHKSFRDISH
jgi:hypothetical protein